MLENQDDPIREQDQIEAEAEALEDEDTYHNPDKLLRIATWTNTISWVVLGLYVLSFVGRLITEVQQPGFRLTLDIQSMMYLLGLLSPLVIGLFYYLLLQAVSEGIYILLDIEENGKKLFQSRQGKP